MNPGAFPLDYVRALCPHPELRPVVHLVAAGMARIERALAERDEDGRPIERRSA